jgi:general stress protein CsbA
MFTVLSVSLVVALLMLALLIAASASITSHSTADIELDAVSMYRQSDLVTDTDPDSVSISARKNP